jgi:hypothetical protein
MHLELLRYLVFAPARLTVPDCPAVPRTNDWDIGTGRSKARMGIGLHSEWRLGVGRTEEQVFQPSILPQNVTIIITYYAQSSN